MAGLSPSHGIVHRGLRVSGGGEEPNFGPGPCREACTGGVLAGSRLPDAGQQHRAGSGVKAIWLRA